jgi:superfamily I DNA and/or RNA helicase
MEEAEIIITTLSSSGSDKIEKIRGEIACLIVDEAAQAT